MADAADPNDLFQASAPPPADPNDLLQASPTPFAQASGFLTDALHKATGGLVDKLNAAGGALGLAGSPENNPGPDFETRYQKNLAESRQKTSQYETDNPKASTAATIAGAVAPLALLQPEAAAGDLWTASKAAAKVGAGVGAAMGFGGTDDTSLKSDLEATGAGFLTGGAVGLATPAASGIAMAPFRMVSRGLKAFTQAGVDQTAGRVLNDAAGATPNFQTAPLPGMKLTAGQSSGDPGLLWLGKAAGEGSPEGEALLQASKDANNTAITTGIQQIGDQATDAPTDMSKALDSLYAKRKTANEDAWKAADVSNTGGISGYQFNNFMQKYVSSLPIADQSVIPKNVMDVVGQIGAAKTQNLSDVQSVASMVKGLARAAGNSGDSNTARVLGGLSDQVGQFVDMKAKNLGAKYPLYKAALADTADMKKTFSTQPAAVKYFGTTGTGADKLPVSSTADNFIHAGKGAPEDLQTYLKMISTKDPVTGAVTYDPASVKAAQDSFGQKFLSTVTNTGEDANGNRVVSPAKLQNFMDNYSHVVNSPLFSQPQRDLMGRIVQATKMASRTPPGTGSDTFQKLQGGKFIDTLIGPGASKLVNIGSSAAGAILGSAHGPVEAAAGLYGGGKVGDMISSMFNAPREKAIALVTEAMHNPQMAQDLMQKASNANAKLLPPTRRAKIMGLLGAQASTPAVAAITQQ